MFTPIKVNIKHFVLSLIGAVVTASALIFMIVSLLTPQPANAATTQTEAGAAPESSSIYRIRTGGYFECLGPIQNSPFGRYCKGRAHQISVCVGKAATEQRWFGTLNLATRTVAINRHEGTRHITCAQRDGLIAFLELRAR